MERVASIDEDLKQNVVRQCRPCRDLTVTAEVTRKWSAFAGGYCKSVRESQEYKNRRTNRQRTSMAHREA